MQTFLAYPDFAQSAKCLDMKRLGKQRVEVLILLNSLHNPEASKGWKNHPAREMWRGHELALIRYGCVICKEWISRDYKDTCFDKIAAHIDNFHGQHYDSLPKWIGDEAFHLSHKSNLIRKMPEHYKPLWPGVPDNLPYVWPAEVKGN